MSLNLSLLETLLTSLRRRAQLPTYMRSSNLAEE
jgi:hypothetical protein